METPYVMAPEKGKMDAGLLAGEISRSDGVFTAQAIPSVADAEMAGGPRGSGEVPPIATVVERSNCRDPIFALLFLLNVASVAYVAVHLGVPVMEDGIDEIKHHNHTHSPTPAPEEGGVDGFELEGLSPSEAKKLLYIGIGVAVAAGAFSYGMMNVMLRQAEKMIECMLYFFYIKMALAGGLLMIVSPFLGIFAFGCLALSCCAFRNIKSRIAFAGANLRVSCLAVREHISLLNVVLLKKVVALAWVGTWFLAFLGTFESLTTISRETQIDPVTGDFETVAVYKAEPGLYPAMIALLFGLVWGKMLLAYIVHCTTSGVVATWWFAPEVAARGGSVVGASLGRAMTSSFGSLSLAAMIVAFLETLVAIARGLRDAGRGNRGDGLGRIVLMLIGCLMECVLRCLENLVKYFNKFAIAYCGIYGVSFCEAGTAVRRLFHQHFWDSIANENLVDMALGLSCFAVGLVGAGLAALGTLAVGGAAAHAWAFMAIIGFVLGFFMMHMQCSVILSGVVTVYICFAEDGEPLRLNHPEEHARLTSAWQSKDPNTLVWIGGAGFGGGF
jgi:hypothetical protein